MEGRADRLRRNDEGDPRQALPVLLALRRTRRSAVQAFRYLGSVRSEAARQKLTEVLDAYVERVAADLRRKRAEILAKVNPS